jgi:D-3-phosphoglycerate dehydrogenase
VWLETTLHAETLARLEQIADVVQSADLRAICGADAAIVTSRPRIDGTLMDRAGPAFKAVARPGIGVDNVDIVAATERGILVLNTPEAPTEATAEHAVALLLALTRRVVPSHMRVHGADIPHHHLLGTEVRSLVLGLVGFGRIGRRVAEICALGLKMRVLAYDPYAEHTAATALGVEMVDHLDILLATADVVSLHTPVTPETHHLIGEQQLQRMKQGAYLINVSRGALIDEAALANALQRGQLSGAALDVFEAEPPAPDNPLLGLPNVVTTPHTGAFTGQCIRAMGDGVVDQLLQLFQGKRPPFLVNAEAWPGRVAR